MAPDATVVADAHGHIRLVNRQTEVVFGYRREQLLGQPVEALIPERFHTVHLEHRAAYAATPRTRAMGSNLHLFGQRQDGSEFPVEVSLAPLEEDGEALVIASIRDVSEVQRVQAANQDLRQLLALTDTALAHLELDELLPELLGRVRDVMAVDNAVILLIDALGQGLRVRAAKGLEEAVAMSVQVPVGQGFAGRIAAGREPLVVEDFANYPTVNPFLRERLRSALGVPLLLGDRVLGVLHVGTIERHAFTAHEVQLLQRVAERVARAIERAQLFERERQAREEAQIAQAEAEVARAESDRQAELLAQTHDAIFVWEWGGPITYWNHGAELLYGYTREEALGNISHDLLRTVHPEARAAFEARLERLGEWTGELVHSTRDGQQVTVLSHHQLVHRPGGGTEVLESSVDITERKWLEHERAVAQANELAVREVNRHLDEFFRTAAHDLRQPVTIAKAHADLTLRRLERLAAKLQASGGPHEAQTEQALRVLATLRQTNASIDRIARLSAELFDLARARTGTLELHVVPLDLEAFVREHVAAQRVAAPGRTIRLTVSDDGQPVWVQADAVRLGQVLTNYLTNALKYSVADKPVDVRLEVTEGLAVVSVQDQGPGLPWEEQSQVWEMLHRAPGVEVQSGGEGSLGMGLFIAKRLVELHPGGRVGVESVVGEGSIFWFRLPLAGAPDKVEAAAARDR
jgi:PAS domain S-box-containing protein